MSGRPLPRASQFALATLVYTAYDLAFAAIFPIRVFGVSFMASAVPVALLILAASSLRGFVRRDIARIAVFAVLGSAWLFAARYGARLPADKFVQVRFLVLIPLWVRVMGSVLKHDRTRGLAIIIISLNTAIASALGVVYRLGYVQLHLASGPDGMPLVNDPLTQTITRASGLYGNPNLYAAMLVVGAIVAVFAVVPRSTPVGLALVGVAGFGVLLAGSRWSLVAIAFLGIAAFSVRSHRSELGTLGRGLRLLVIAVAVVSSMSTASSTVHRLRSGDHIRQYKDRLALDALTQRTATFVAGGDPQVYMPANAEVERIFSDNSFLLMPLVAGVPLFLWLLSVTFLGLRAPPEHGPRWHRRVVGAVALGTLLLNNASAWDIWVIAMSATYWIVVYDDAQRTTGSRDWERLTEASTVFA